jgi:hypothetical protein
VWGRCLRLLGALGRARGEGRVEYALILVLLVILVLTAATTMGQQISRVLQSVVGGGSR